MTKNQPITMVQLLCNLGYRFLGYNPEAIPTINALTLPTIGPTTEELQRPLIDLQHYLASDTHPTRTFLRKTVAAVYELERKRDLPSVDHYDEFKSYENVYNYLVTRLESKKKSFRKTLYLALFPHRTEGMDEVLCELTKNAIRKVQPTVSKNVWMLQTFNCFDDNINYWVHNITEWQIPENEQGLMAVVSTQNVLQVLKYFKETHDTQNYKSPWEIIILDFASPEFIQDFVKAERVQSYRIDGTLVVDDNLFQHADRSFDEWLVDNWAYLTNSYYDSKVVSTALVLHDKKTIRLDIKEMWVQMYKYEQQRYQEYAIYMQYLLQVQTLPIFVPRPRCRILSRTDAEKVLKKLNTPAPGFWTRLLGREEL